MKTNNLSKHLVGGATFVAFALYVGASDRPPTLFQLAFPGATTAEEASAAPAGPSPLTLAYARTWGNPNGVEVVFSAPVLESTATNQNHYTISGGILVSRATMGANAYSVVLTTTTMADSIAHTLTVNNVQDLSTPPNTIPANSQAPVLKGQGVITRKLFTGIPYSGIAGLTNHAKFPNSPDGLDFPANAESPQNLGDSYGVQLVGFVNPPVTGDYQFFVSADEQGVLFLSLDENPLNKTAIANVPSAVGYRAWLTVTNQQSAYVRLEAGRRYYLEALMAEGSGADHLSVTWRMRGMLLPNPGDAPIPGAFLSSATPSGPAGVAVHPQNLSVSERQPTTFGVVPNGTPPYGFQWLRGGIPIPGANGSNYTLSSARMLDNGAAFSAIVSNGFSSVTSSVAVLTVLPDLAPPTIVRVSGGATMDRVLLSFSEPVTSGTANDSSHYAISGSLAVLDAKLQPDQTNVVLTTAPQSSGQTYTVTVSGVTDTANAHNAANTTSTFTAWVLSRGFLHRDLYYNLGTGGAISDLTGNARFPDSPDAIGEIGSFETPANIAEGYGQRLLGFLLPPVTGFYTFYISSDDQGLLYLSPDESRANTSLIASEPQYDTGPRYWIGTVRRNPTSPENVSLPVWLQAGQRYYVEVLMKEAYGGDHVGVAWQLPGAAAPVNGDPPIGGAYLSCYANPLGASLTITPPPPSVAVLEAAITNFTVGVTSSSSLVFYQWQKDGTDIPGANSATYTTPRLFRGDDGARFRCFVSIPGTNLFSAEATVSVTPDTRAPQIIAGATLAGSTNIGVCFSEMMDPASVTNPANYTVSYGAAVTGVTLRPDGQSVAVTVSGLCFTNFTARVNNLKDLSGNTLPANTTIPVAVQPLESLDVGTTGDPAIAGSTYTCQAGNFDMVAGGSYIWNNADHFQFAFEVREGDFDVQVRLARIDRTDHWSAGGLMARENLSAGSRHVWAGMNTPQGQNQYGCGYRAVQDGTSAAWPGSSVSGGVPLPNAWLRLKRAGDIFTAYRGTNGVDWTQFAQISNALPSRLLVGPGATANNNGGTTTVWFRDYSSTPPSLPAPPVDLLVKTLGEPPTAYALSNVYQVLPSGPQIRMAAARTNAPASFLVRVENDSAQTLSPVLRAGESSETNWTVVYRDGAADISAQIRSAAGYTLTNLLGGASAVIAVDLLPNGRTLGGATRSATLSVYRDRFAPTPRDVVRAAAFNTPVFQPDLLVRRLSDVAYLGENVYNASGASQTKSQKVEPGALAVYPLLLANDGNLTNYFAVRGTAGGGGWSVRYFDAVSAGAEITSDVTGGGTLVALAPGASWEFHAEILPDIAVPRGTSNTVLVTATSLADATASDTVKLITITKTVTNVPQSRTFTLDDDFAEGTFIGTVARNNQLELSAESITPPYIWVPNSGESTVSKVDIRTGKEVGRYRTGPPSAGNGNPSRTTVDQFGNCWVANRNHGTIVKIGLYENGQSLDRNGDGLIQTSQDLDGDGNIAASEVLDWGKDECVLWEVVIIPGKEGAFVPGTYTGGYGGYNDAGSRSIAADQWGNVWAGNYTAKRYYYLDNATGQILRTNDLSSVGHAPYGSVVDAFGMLWSAAAGLNHVLRLNPADNSILVTNIGHTAYGLGIDRNNHLFVSGWQASALSRINVLTAEKEWTRAGIYESRGVAVTADGDVWVANSNPGTVARWSNDGVLKTSLSVGNQPTGVSIDSEGKVWVVNLGDGLIRRIDPANDTIIFTRQINALGGGAAGHYGYSDMTGNVARNATVRYGQWIVIHDAQVEFAQWGTVTWNAYEPAGSNVTVRVRSSQDLARWSSWEKAPNGVALGATPPGRYLQVEVAMWSLVAQDLPVLYDLTVEPLPQRTADLGLGLQAAPAAVTNEQQITYTILLTNLGPQDARGVFVTNRLASGVTVTSISNSLGTITQTSGVVRCEVGALPAGSSVVMTIVVDVSTSGILTNLVGVSHYEIDLVPQNNSAMAATPAAAIPCLPPPLNLVSWWPGEGSASDLVSTNHGLYSGGLTNVAGRVGQAFRFNGTDAYVRVPASSNLNIGLGSGLTLEAWVKVNDFSQRPLLEWQRINNAWGVHWWLSVTAYGGGAGSIYVNLTDTARVDHPLSTAPGVLTTNAWHHLAFTYDRASGLGTFYANGTNVTSRALGSFIPQTSSDLYFGWRPGEAYRFLGLMDEVAIYNRALGSNEIAAIHAARSSGKCKPAADPRLNISPAATSGYLAWWTSEAVGYRLIAAPALDGPWSAVSPDAVPQGTNFVVPVSATGPGLFYRLRKP